MCLVGKRRKQKCLRLLKDTAYRVVSPQLNECHGFQNSYLHLTVPNQGGSDGHGLEGW